MIRAEPGRKSNATAPTPIATNQPALDPVQYKVRSPSIPKLPTTKRRTEAFRVALTVASTAKDAGKSNRIIPANAFG